MERVVFAPLKRNYSSGYEENSQSNIPQETVEFKTEFKADHEVI